MIKQSTRPQSALFTNCAEIEYWLKRHLVHSYVIEHDLTVNVDSFVSIENCSMSYLPVNFGTVSGGFHVPNIGLKSLEGSPKILEGGFYCQENLLTDLIGMPENVGHYVDVKHNQLTSFLGAPKNMEDNLDARHNPISSLEGLPVHFSNLLLAHRNVLVPALRDYYKRDVVNVYCLCMASQEIHIAHEKYLLKQAIQNVDHNTMTAHPKPYKI